MATEAPVEIEIKEDAKPLLPGVGVLIDTERLAAGREDVYYIVIYGKRYYGSTPEDVVVRTKRYVQEKGPIAAPVKTSMFSKFGTRRASGNSPSSGRRGFSLKMPSFGRSSSGPKASGSKGWGLPSVKLPSVSLPSFSRKPKASGAAPAGAPAAPPAKNKPLPTPATGNGEPEETNEQASARLKASFNSNNSLKGVKIGQLEGTVSLPKPKPAINNNNDNIQITRINGPGKPADTNAQQRMIEAAKAKKAANAAKAAQTRPGEFNNWAKDPDPFAAQGSGKMPGGKVPNVNLQDGGARKPGPRRVTRRPRSMFTKPRSKMALLAPTH